MKKKRKKRSFILIIFLLIMVVPIGLEALVEDPVTTSEGNIIIDVPQISQLPELPRGCEVTALAMLLQFNGMAIDKLELAEQVRKVPFKENGLLGNPNEGFVGSMTSLAEPGYGVYQKPISELAESYFHNKVNNLTGKGFDSVIEALDKGQPVWIVTNTLYSQLPEERWETWETKHGEIEITYKEHSVVITGYDPEYVYFNDPLANEKNRKMPRQPFVLAWQQMGSQAITINNMES